MIEKGAHILKKIDEYQGEAETGNIDSRLEDAIEAHRADGFDAGDEILNDDELEEMIAKRLRSRKGKLSGFCSQCGTPMQQTDMFCSKCGQQLN